MSGPLGILACLLLLFVLKDPNLGSDYSMESPLVFTCAYDYLTVRVLEMCGEQILYPSKLSCV